MKSPRRRERCVKMGAAEKCAFVRGDDTSAGRCELTVCRCLSLSVFKGDMAMVIGCKKCNGDKKMHNAIQLDYRTFMFDLSHCQHLDRVGGKGTDLFKYPTLCTSSSHLNTSLCPSSTASTSFAIL